MLIVVAVETQQLPVAAVRRVVIVVLILVMDRELANFFAAEFAPAARADPRKKFERALPICLGPLFPLSPQFGIHLFQFVC